MTLVGVPIFAHQALRQELPPDEFLAMASILGCSYADSSRPDLRGLASRWRTRGSPVAASISPLPSSLEHAGEEQVRGRSRGPSQLSEEPVRMRSRSRGQSRLEMPSSSGRADAASVLRSWPAGATPGSRFATTASHTVPLIDVDSSMVMHVGGEAVLRPKPKQRPGPASLPATVDLTGPSQISSDVASGLQSTADAAAAREALTQPVTAIQAYSLLPDRLGEYLGPACLSYCQERQDFEVSWGATETLAVYGRPLHSDRTTRLFLHDVDLEYAGFPDATRAPETPPMILEGMRHRARLQDQAGEALRQAAASGASGDGTPPLAFTPDGDVSDFMDRYLYKGARGDSAWIISSSKSGISPAWLPQDPPLPHVLPVGPLLWVFDFGQLVAIPALGHSGVHLFQWSSAPAHHMPPPLVPTLSVFSLCHRSVAAASPRLLVRRCCRLVSPPSIVAPTSLWVSRTNMHRLMPDRLRDLLKS